MRERGGGGERNKKTETEGERERKKREREGVRHMTGLTLFRVKIPIGTGTCVNLGLTVSNATATGHR